MSNTASTGKVIVLGDYAEYDAKLDNGEWTYDQHSAFFSNSRLHGINNSVFPFAIGGSDAGTIMGVSHFKTPLELYYEKTGMIPVEKPTKEQYTRFAVGHKFEAIFRDLFTMISGISAEPCTIQVMNSKYPHLVANVDGVVWEKDKDGILRMGLYEGKTTAEFTDVHKCFLRGEVPLSYFCQVQFYLELWDLDFAYINCAWGLNPLTEMKFIRVERDRQAGEEICRACEQFVERAMRGLRPSNENVQCLSALQRCYQRLYGNGDITKPPVKISNQYRATFERYKELCDMEAKVKKNMEPIQAQLKPHEKELKDIDKQKEEIKKLFPAVLLDSTCGTFTLDNEQITVNYKPTGKYALDKEVKEYWASNYPDCYNDIMTYKEVPRKIEIEIKKAV